MMNSLFRRPDKPSGVEILKGIDLPSVQDPALQRLAEAFSHQSPHDSLVNSMLRANTIKTVSHDYLHSSKVDSGTKILINRLANQVVAHSLSALNGEEYDHLKSDVNHRGKELPAYRLTLTELENMERTGSFLFPYLGDRSLTDLEELIKSIKADASVEDDAVMNAFFPNFSGDWSLIFDIIAHDRGEKPDPNVFSSSSGLTLLRSGFHRSNSQQKLITADQTLKADAKDMVVDIAEAVDAALADGHFIRAGSVSSSRELSVTAESRMSLPGQHTRLGDIVMTDEELLYIKRVRKCLDTLEAHVKSMILLAQNRSAGISRAHSAGSVGVVINKSFIPYSSDDSHAIGSCVSLDLLNEMRISMNGVFERTVPPSPTPSPSARDKVALNSAALSAQTLPLARVELLPLPHPSSSDPLKLPSEQIVPKPESIESLFDEFYSFADRSSQWVGSEPLSPPKRAEIVDISVSSPWPPLLGGVTSRLNNVIVSFSATPSFQIGPGIDVPTMQTLSTSDGSRRMASIAMPFDPVSKDPLFLHQYYSRSTGTILVRSSAELVASSGKLLQTFPPTILSAPQSVAGVPVDVAEFLKFFIPYTPALVPTLAIPDYTPQPATPPSNTDTSTLGELLLSNTERVHSTPLTASFPNLLLQFTSSDWDVVTSLRESVIVASKSGAGTLEEQKKIYLELKRRPGASNTLVRAHAPLSRWTIARSKQGLPLCPSIPFFSPFSASLVRRVTDVVISTCHSHGIRAVMGVSPRSPLLTDLLFLDRPDSAEFLTFLQALASSTPHAMAKLLSKETLVVALGMQGRRRAISERAITDRLSLDIRSERAAAAEAVDATAGAGEPLSINQIPFSSLPHYLFLESSKNGSSASRTEQSMFSSEQRNGQNKFMHLALPYRRVPTMDANENEKSVAMDGVLPLPPSSRRLNPPFSLSVAEIDAVSFSETATPALTDSLGGWGTRNRSNANKTLRSSFFVVPKCDPEAPRPPSLLSRNGARARARDLLLPPSLRSSSQLHVAGVEDSDLHLTGLTKPQELEATVEDSAAGEVAFLADSVAAVREQHILKTVFRGADAFASNPVNM